MGAITIDCVNLCLKRLGGGAGMIEPSEVDGYHAFFAATKSRWFSHLVDRPAEIAIKVFLPPSREADTRIQIPIPEESVRIAWKKGWYLAREEFIASVEIGNEGSYT
jgi:hypothetical protein